MPADRLTMAPLLMHDLKRSFGFRIYKNTTYVACNV